MVTLMHLGGIVALIRAYFAAPICSTQLVLKPSINKNSVQLDHHVHAALQDHAGQHMNWPLDFQVTVRKHRRRVSNILSLGGGAGRHDDEIKRSALPELFSLTLHTALDSRPLLLQHVCTKVC